MVRSQNGPTFQSRLVNHYNLPMLVGQFVEAPFTLRDFLTSQFTQRLWMKHYETIEHGPFSKMIY